MSDREEPNSKWQALLQPIRDLEKNWDIDIAGELTDYLEELSQITFEVDGLCNLDFAEAALVVHGSSCTYGKKVEHLFKLTISALENVRQKHDKKSIGKRRKAADNGDDGRQLGIVDVLHFVADANLQHCEEGALPRLQAPEAQPALLHDVLMAEAFPIVANLVEAKAPRQLLERFATGPSDAPTFNMIQCHDHLSGALLLLKEDGDAFDTHMRPACVSSCQIRKDGCYQESITATSHNVIHAFGSPVDHLGPPNAESAPHMDAHAGHEEAATELAGDWFGAAIDDGFDSAADLFLSDACAQQGAPVANAQEYDMSDDSGEEEAGNFARNWLVVDPHDASQNRDKPFRRHQPCAPKLKPELKTPSCQPFLVPAFCAAAQDRLQLLVPTLAPSPQPLNGTKQTVVSLEEPAIAQRPGPALDTFEPNQNELMHTPGDQMLAEPTTGEWMVHFDGVACDSAVAGSAYDDTGDDAAERDWQGASNLAAIECEPTGMRDAVPQAALAYEELVAQYTLAVAAATHNATNQQLESRKVTAWKASIRQVIQEQLARPPFDVHATGKQLVQRAGIMAQKKDHHLCFADIVQCHHKYEVARCFSAFLQQVNNDSVNLVRGNTPADPFYVKLSSSGNK
eukprot:jgi/Ulvmu1/5909/UM026_0031.1